MHECMTRIVSGTAKINMGLGLVDEKLVLVATPKEFVTALAKCIRATCVDMKRWGGAHSLPNLFARLGGEEQSLPAQGGRHCWKTW